MKRFSGLAALAMLGAATGANAQSGPVNHKTPAGAVAAQPPVEADMMPPPPEADVASQISQIRATVQNDLEQHKISRRSAAHLKHKLEILEGRAEALNHSLSKIAASLP